MEKKTLKTSFGPMKAVFSSEIFLCYRKEGQRPKAKPRLCALQETYAEKNTTVSRRFVTHSCVCAYPHRVCFIFTACMLNGSISLAADRENETCGFVQTSCEVYRTATEAQVDCIEVRGMCSYNSSLEGATKLTFVQFCSF